MCTALVVSSLRNLFLLRTRWARSAAVVAILATQAQAQGGWWFVDDDAAPGGFGHSWQDAFQNLSQALAQAQPGDTVWVAEGHYVPEPVSNPPPDPRSVTFLIPYRVHVVGGFLGNEVTQEPLGDPLKTILSGDLGVQGSSHDNAYHVVSVLNPWQEQVEQRLERFVVQDGRADGPFDRRGAGLLLIGFDVRLSELTVRRNEALNGGGCFAMMGYLRARWCTFEDNSAATEGGALRFHLVVADIHNSRFLGNRSILDGGAAYLSAISQYASGPLVRFLNCWFQDNSSATSNGGAAALDSDFSLAGMAMWTNCTFLGNRCATSGSGSAIYTEPPAGMAAVSVLRNCIVWGNGPAPALANAHTVSWSDVEGGVWPGPGNLSADPLLAANGVPSPGSPVIDAGNTRFVPEDLVDVDGDGKINNVVPLDLLGRRRLVDFAGAPNSGSGDPPVDMGALETP
jgi:hypothetical protein